MMALSPGCGWGCIYRRYTLSPTWTSICSRVCCILVANVSVHPSHFLPRTNFQIHVHVVYYTEAMCSAQLLYWSGHGHIAWDVKLEIRVFLPTRYLHYPLMDFHNTCQLDFHEIIHNGYSLYEFDHVCFRGETCESLNGEISSRQGLTLTLRSPPLIHQVDGAQMRCPSCLKL